MKTLIKFLYERFVGEIYLPHNSEKRGSVEIWMEEDEKRGKFTMNGKNYSIRYVDLKNNGGKGSFYYFKYPFWKFRPIHPSSEQRIFDFGYDFDIYEIPKIPILFPKK